MCVRQKNRDPAETIGSLSSSRGQCQRRWKWTCNPSQLLPGPCLQASFYLLSLLHPVSTLILLLKGRSDHLHPFSIIYTHSSSTLLGKGKALWRSSVVCLCLPFQPHTLSFNDQKLLCFLCCFAQLLLAVLPLLRLWSSFGILFPLVLRGCFSLWQALRLTGDPTSFLRTPLTPRKGFAAALLGSCHQ